MRKTFLLSCYIIILLCGTLTIEASQPMWKISGNGLQQPSYLFGTSALQSVMLYHQSPKLQNAFAQSSVLIVESNSTPGEFITKIRTYGLMKEQKLKQLLPEDLYKKVDKEVKEAITIGLFFLPGSIKPSAVSMIICSSWLKEVMGHKNEEYLTKHLLGLCKKRKIPIVTLESAEEQMDLMMNRESPANQANLLKELIEQKEEMIQSYKLGQTYYQQGEYEKMAQLGLDHPLPYAKNSKELEKIITQRNREWVEKIISQMQQKGCLILLNPAQLVFQGGMIEELKRAGYTVEKE